MQAYRTFISDVKHTFGWRIYAIVVAMVAVGVTEGLCTPPFLPLLNRLGIAGRAAPTQITKVLEGVFSLIAPNTGVMAVLVILIAFAIVQFALSTALNWHMAYMTRRYVAQWQARLFSAILNADWTFLTEHKSGEFSNAILVETARMGAALQTLLLIASYSSVTIVYLCLAFMVSWQGTALMMLVSVLMGLSALQLYKMSHAVGGQMAAINSSLQVLVGEYLAAAKIIKATSSEGRAIRRVTGVFRKLEDVLRTEAFLPAFVRLAFELVGFIALAGFLVFGIVVMEMPAASMLVLLALFLRLLPRFATLQVHLHGLNMRVPAILAANSILTAANAQREAPAGNAEALAIAAPTNITVRNLSVALNDKIVLKNIDVTFPIPGMIGIVGGSGAGKSTLIHALLGLVRPRSGTIHFGSYAIETVPPATWRLKIGYVPQETLLFHASVRENISLTNPDASLED